MKKLIERHRDRLEYDILKNTFLWGIPAACTVLGATVPKLREWLLETYKPAWTMVFPIVGFLSWPAIALYLVLRRPKPAVAPKLQVNTIDASTPEGRLQLERALAILNARQLANKDADNPLLLPHWVTPQAFTLLKAVRVANTKVIRRETSINEDETEYLIDGRRVGTHIAEDIEEFDQALRHMVVMQWVTHNNYVQQGRRKQKVSVYTFNDAGLEALRRYASVLSGDEWNTEPHPSTISKAQRAKGPHAPAVKAWIAAQSPSQTTTDQEQEQARLRLNKELNDTLASYQPPKTVRSPGVSQPPLPAVLSHFPQYDTELRRILLTARASQEVCVIAPLLKDGETVRRMYSDNGNLYPEDDAEASRRHCEALTILANQKFLEPQGIRFNLTYKGSRAADQIAASVEFWEDK